jgi:hypothetical protein
MKWILTTAVLLLTFILAVSPAFSQVAEIERCIPCERANSDVQTLGFASKTLGHTSDFRFFNGNHVVNFSLSDSLARTNLLEAQSVQPENQQKFVGFNCYYWFSGATTCFNHTLYGYYCLVGSWYCQLLGSCRWIAIGSCK